MQKNATLQKKRGTLKKTGIMPPPREKNANAIGATGGL
jgi:hypothetical protein